jgi:hypothetical protein
MTMKVSAAICALLLLFGGAAGQITLTSTDVPNTVGDTFWYKFNDGTVSVNVGDQGGPHTWTFDTAAFPGWVGDQQIVAKAGTPFAARFPSANLCLHESYPGDTTEIYMYSEIETNGYTYLGQGFVTPETSVAEVYNPTELMMPFPLTYGANWDTRFGWVDTVGDSMRMVHDNFLRSSIDAYGTVEVPHGTFPCLRLNSVRLCITAMYIGGMMIYADSTWSRLYRWLVRGLNPVANATSLPDDTSLMFTQSDCYTVMIGSNCGAVAEPRHGLRGRAAEATFVGNTLRLVGDRAALLVDGSGRTVADLAPGTNDIRHVAPGVYFMREGSRIPGSRGSRVRKGVIQR